MVGSGTLDAQYDEQLEDETRSAASWRDTVPSRHDADKSEVMSILTTYVLVNHGTGVYVDNLKKSDDIWIAELCTGQPARVLGYVKVSSNFEVIGSFPVYTVKPGLAFFVKKWFMRFQGKASK